MKSILVAVDGSKDAMNASEAAWMLAKANKSKILAMSVIDTQSIWDFMGQKLAGLIGSGPYVAAYESIYNSMKAISDALLMAFESRSQGHGIQTETIITEGNLAETLLKHGESHDLIVMGRRDKTPSGNRTLIRTSLSEKLAQASTTPVLMVSSEPRRWKTARFIFDSQSFDRQQVLQFFELAKVLKLQPELFCTDENVEESRKRIKEYCATPAPIFSHDSTYGDESWQSAIDVTSSTLMIISTCERGGERCLGNGPNIGKFMHTMPMLSFVLFPPKQEATQNAKSKLQASETLATV
jgi:nucleotide-binding universal stress UspA family protein